MLRVFRAVIIRCENTFVSLCECQKKDFVLVVFALITVLGIKLYLHSLFWLAAIIKRFVDCYCFIVFLKGSPD